MAKYVRKLGVSEQTFLQKVDSENMFKIVYVMVRHELGILNTCYVPKAEKVRPIMERILNDMIICEGPFIIDFDTATKESKDDVIKAINILGLYSLDQNIKITDKYMEVIWSPEFKAWEQSLTNLENEPNKDKLSIREIKNKCIDVSRSLAEVLKKQGIIQEETNA